MVSETQDPNRFVYRVDAADRISFVNEAWLRFAVENGAPQLSESNVLGHLLWDHISGPEVSRLYRELFLSVRAHSTEVMIPFNCDSPSLVRHMTLTLRSLGGGHIELEGRLHSVVARVAVALLHHQTPRSERVVPICSLCRRLQIDREWMPVATALVQHRWTASMPAPKLGESLCPDCERVAFDPIRPLN